MSKGFNFFDGVFIGIFIMGMFLLILSTLNVGIFGRVNISHDTANIICQKLGNSSVSFETSTTSSGSLICDYKVLHNISNKEEPIIFKSSEDKT